MLITQSFSWPPVFWPTSSTLAAQYTVLQVYPGPTTVVTSVPTASAQIVYDDSLPQIYQVRPSSGTAPSLTYGPEVAVFVNGYVPCRAWLRNTIRQAISDRTDGINANINWPDDEINNYIQQALTELNILFPTEADTTIALTTSIRNYALPTDFYLAKTVEYITVDGKLHLYLKEKPFRGGESTATSYLGYPKLGILLSPMAGRYFPGHYEMYENQIFLDWDAAGDGDVIKLRYSARRPFPVSDSDLMNVTSEDMNLLSLRVQMSCWYRVEGQDTRLSRFRDKTEGSKRDDMPTVKHSDIIKRLYNEMVNDRRETRPRVKRLVRR